MKFFVLPNLASHETLEIETGTGDLYQVAIDCNPSLVTLPSGVVTKEQFSAWATNPTTDYCFFSTLSGTSANLRISQTNPPRWIYGMVADYDAELSATEMETLLARCNAHCMPSFACRTFSGNARLVWCFAERIPWFNQQAWDLFAKKFIKEAHVKRLLPGYDDKSTESAQVFALGGEWVPVAPDGVLPSQNLLLHWVEQATKRVKWGHEGVTIPLEALQEEVALRFGDRWKGPFEVGARGCRFWDPTSDNDTGAIVRPTGMQCFTGDQPFVPWFQIFGGDFVKQFAADRIGHAIAEIWFDGDKYWMKAAAGHWVGYTKQDIALHLEVTLGLANAKDGDETSEVKRALAAIQLTRRIDGAVPLPGMQEGVIHYNGSDFLNTIRVRPVAPVPGTLTAEQVREGCGFTLELLDRLLGPEQYGHFIAWLKRFYVSHYERKPLPGQVIVLAGSVAVGKTFTSNVIIGRLMGGHSDGSDYLMGRTQFNRDLMGVPVITVDDSTPTASATYLNAFTAMLKRVAANHSMQFNAKFRDTYLLPNSGRTIVTCNADPESLRILPDTDQNVLDKVLLFLAEPAAADFTFPADAAAQVTRELPYFARYLIELEVAPQYLADTRFGVAPFYHPELLGTARSSNATHSFKELLDLFLADYFAVNVDAENWTGSSTQILQEMLLNEGLKEIARKLAPVAVGRALGQLMGQDYPIHQDRSSAARTWVIEREILNPETR